MDWIIRVKKVQKIHQEQLKLNPAWRLVDTARLLQRSIGSISQDIQLASWLKTHSVQLEKIETAQEALKYIKRKRREMRLY